MQMTKFIRKPYAGKPHVRIEEGVGKVLSFPLYSTAYLTTSTFFEIVSFQILTTNFPKQNQSFFYKGVIAYYLHKCHDFYWGK